MLGRRHSARFGTLLIAAALAAGGWRTAAGAQPDPAAAQNGRRQPGFTVATYNVNWGNVDLRQTVALLRKAEADLVLLQETNARSEAYLRAQLRGTYPHTLFRGDRGQYAAERFGILAKSPVGKLRFLPPRHGLFGAWIGEIDLSGRKLQIVNVHLQPAILQANMGVRAAMAALSEMEKTHAGEIEHVFRNLTPDVPTLVAGDFNSMSQFAAPRFLVARGFVDSFAAVTEKPDEHPTWRWPVGQLELSLRIDYLFHTRHLRTVESRTIDGKASDHLLVVSRLEWAEEGRLEKSSAGGELLEPKGPPPPSAAPARTPTR